MANRLYCLGAGKSVKCVYSACGNECMFFVFGTVFMRYDMVVSVVVRASCMHNNIVDTVEQEHADWR